MPRLPTPNPNSNKKAPPNSSIVKRRPPSSFLNLRSSKTTTSLKHAVYKMRLQSLPPATPPPVTVRSPSPDFCSLLSDKLLLHVFSFLPPSQRLSNSLVCKRWCLLSGQLRHSLRLLNWVFLISGRLFTRFPNLTAVDLVPSCVDSVENDGIWVTHRLITFSLDARFSAHGFISGEANLFPSCEIDRGLRVLASGYSNLSKLVLLNASQAGLSCVAGGCFMLQELELHYCTDDALKGISGCRNLQIVKLVGSVNGFYENAVTDIGLTILAQGCTRLVKLELSGCEGSYDGIKALGQCCVMLEEMTISDHRMEGGWLSALSYFETLKTLRIQSCRNIDLNPGLDEHLGMCPTLEELHVLRCQLRDKQSVRALFSVCEAVRDIVLQDCWGLEDDIFKTATVCRRVRFLSLEGCSLLSMEGFDSVILSWPEIQRVRVVSCNNIKDSEVTPGVAALFCVLKEFKWSPDSRSLLAANITGTGVGKKGSRFFKRVQDMNWLFLIFPLVAYWGSCIHDNT